MLYAWTPQSCSFGLYCFERAAARMYMPVDVQDGRGIGRSDSVTSDDHRDYGELLHNLQSVCADDPAFREALAADAAPKQAWPRLETPLPPLLPCPASHPTGSMCGSSLLHSIAIQDPRCCAAMQCC